MRAHTPYERVLGERGCPARVVQGARLNYAEHMVGLDEDPGRVAVVARSQSRDPFEVTLGDLRDQVARARAGLQRLGVGPGDRVVAYLPNIPETLVAFLATASLGAVWATLRARVRRRARDRPLRHRRAEGPARGGRLRLRRQRVDRRPEVAAIRAALPDARARRPRPATGRPRRRAPRRPRRGTTSLAEPAPLRFDPVPFDHPLCVLFSSGTTGLPKPIVHGHGGILVSATRTTA